MVGVVLLCGSTVREDVCAHFATGECLSFNGKKLLIRVCIDLEMERCWLVHQSHASIAQTFHSTRFASVRHGSNSSFLSQVRVSSNAHLINSTFSYARPVHVLGLTCSFASTRKHFCFLFGPCSWHPSTCLFRIGFCSYCHVPRCTMHLLDLLFHSIASMAPHAMVASSSVHPAQVRKTLDPHGIHPFLLPREFDPLYLSLSTVPSPRQDGIPFPRRTDGPSTSRNGFRFFFFYLGS